jgi:hypothetical protein
MVVQTIFCCIAGTTTWFHQYNEGEKMSDLFDVIIFGMEAEAYNQRWVVLQSFGDHLYLAVKADVKMPAQTYLIQAFEIKNPTPLSPSP